jgi:predicted CoA-binding protein
MIHFLAEQQQIKQILLGARTVAVVGLSPKGNRPSHQVASYLIAAGYTVIPVNPGQIEILGQKCYPNLDDIPVPVDVVDIFRTPSEVLPVVEAAVRIKAKVVWMQLDIVSREAAAVAENAGLVVVMDRCIKTDHMNLVRMGA